MGFVDRTDAGERLATRLRGYERRPDTLVLGLPRGGVVVAAVVARRLGLPLDVWVARKVGAPFNPELGIGAVSHHGVRVLDPDALGLLRIAENDLGPAIEREREELARRLVKFRNTTVPADVAGKTVLLVDDGLATGVTAQAAIEALRRSHAARIVLALPVAPTQALPSLGASVDELVVLEHHLDFDAVGKWYEDFDQTSDEEVLELLDPSPAAEGVAA